MERRRFLTATATGALAVLAGCENPGEPTTDGTGDVDTDGQAPTAPQDGATADGRNGGGTVSPTITTTPEPGDVPTPTPEPPPEPPRPGYTLRVTDEYWAGLTHIESYGTDGARVAVRRDSHTETVERARLRVVAFDYETGTRFAQSTTEPFALTDAPFEVAIEVDLTDAPADRRIGYNLHLVAPDREEVIAGVMGTDPFRLLDDRDSVERAPHPRLPGAAATDTFERAVVEGAYLLTFTGRTAGTDWVVRINAQKWVYLRRINARRGRSRAEYVTYELTEGEGRVMASVLDDAAERNGFTTGAEKLGFAVDFVQGLPYVTDDVSKGYDDYTKFLTETLVEGSGDCEDTAIMLAAILEAPPYGVDAVLVQPPGHMAVGIAGDFSGYYFELDGTRYYYVETTGEGWGIGEIPDIFRDDDVTIFEV